MRELGIVFGCFDLAIDGKGEAHFLEVNQAGQFLFVEEMAPQLPLLQAMFAMLAQGRTDYRLEPDPSLTYAASPARAEHAPCCTEAGRTGRASSWGRVVHTASISVGGV